MDGHFVILDEAPRNRPYQNAAAAVLFVQIFSSMPVWPWQAGGLAYQGLAGTLMS